MMVIFLGLSVAILVVAVQILLKLGVAGKIHNIESFLRSLTSPFAILAAILYIVAVVIWIFLLSRHPLHSLYGFLGLTFIFALLAARLFLHEDVSWISWTGAGIIFLGVILISIGSR